ncbi:MAG TPA: toll/interleukin-1 receptor domain-containing protein [Burkholderiales bacterium]|nr:toll/interleukin-1 receptor domain-containing protein [Burkholderiales bacterium]
MADVFVSYASPDREKAKLLADIIAARGHSVWWDRTIPPGRMFDEVIQEALHAAKCVVVLWSKVSVASNWVKTEAAEAASRGVLVPAVIENVVLPLEFKRIQAAGLAGWNGDPNHPELKSLLNAIERVMRGDSSGLGVRPLTAGDAEAGGRRGATRSESESPARARPKLGMVGVAAGLVVLTAAG